MPDPTLISRRYEVIEKVGQGGMATVYKVRHTTLGSISALKILPQGLMEDPEMVSRFYREARIMAQLGHPNIVRVLDIDHDEALSFHYLVMEYVEGQTLRQRIDKAGPLSLAETLAMGRQVGSAIAYAHRHSPPIVHRDIKPSNIMIEAVTGRFVLMDFGIAKELGTKELTRPGVTVGTLKYCPPEQMRQEPLDGGADIYALGIVLFEALTGAHPLAGLRDRELIARVLDETVEHDPPFPDDTPSSFRALIRKAITKRRSKRLGAIDDLLRGLEEVQSAVTQEDAAERARAVAAERERRRQAELEAKARERAERTSAARGAARSAGAERYAADVFERAAGEALRGERFLGDEAWEEAGQAFAQAMALFEEATRVSEREKYREEARRLRAEAASLLDVAEREGARERVPDRFLDIDALIAAAGRPFESDDLTTARSGFERAVGLLREARESARRRAERDAAEREQERARSLAARVAAAGRPIGRRAERRLRQAEKELAEERYVEARRLFSEAAEQLASEGVPLSGEDDETMIAPAEVRDPTLSSRLRARPLPLIAAGVAAFALLLLGWWSLRPGDSPATSANSGTATAASRSAAQEAPGTRASEPAAESGEREARPAAEPIPPVAVAASSERDPPPAVAASAVEQPDTTAVESAPASGESAGGAETTRAAPDALARLDTTRETATPTDRAGAPGEASSDEDLARLEDPTAGLESETAPTTSEVREPPLRRLSSTAKLQLDLPVTDLGQATLDGKQLPVSKEGPLRVVIDKLPIGESSHELRLTDTSGATRIQPIEVTHYPGWEILKNGRLASEAYGLDVSPDGKRAVSGSRDSRVKLWDLETGELLRSIEGHRDWVNDVAFAFGGDAVLSGSKDRTLKLWSTEDGALLRTLEGHKGWVNAVAVSPDGKRGASVSDDRTVRIWDLETGEELRSLTGHTDWAFAVAFTPDGRSVVSAGKDNTVRLWDVETGELKSTLRGHRDWVSAIAVTPAGDRAISGSDDRTARIWNLVTGKEERTLRGHRDWVVAVAVSPDGSRVVTGSKDGSARVWDLETGELLRTFTGHRAMVSGIAFTPDGQRVVSTGRDRALRIWWVGPEELPEAPPASASLAPASDR